MLCEKCIHKNVCGKSEGYFEAYAQNGLILDCEDFLEKDKERRTIREAKELLEEILQKGEKWESKKK